MFISCVTSILRQLYVQKWCDGELKDFKAKLGSVLSPVRIEYTHIPKCQTESVHSSLEVSGSMLYLLFSVWGSVKKRKEEGEIEKDFYAHICTHAPSIDLGSITEPQHHTHTRLDPVWRSACSPWASVKHTLKCHVTAVIEHEELAEIELCNAGSQWLLILMNSVLFCWGWVLCQSWQTSSTSHSSRQHSVLFLHAYTHVQWRHI